MPAKPAMPLSEADRALLSVRADQFHDALVHDPAADWSPFLDGLAGAVRIAVLTELAVIDMGHRWEQGERPTVADYLDRYPELGPIDQAPGALVREAQRCRTKAAPARQATADSRAAPH